MVDKELISRFFLTCKDYEKAYREGHICNTVDTKVREYKSYCRVHTSQR